MEYPWIAVAAIAVSPFVLAAASWLAAVTIARVMSRRRILRELGPAVVALSVRRRVSGLGAWLVLSALAVKAIVATMSVAAAWALALAGVFVGIWISAWGGFEPGFRIDDQALDEELRALLDDVA